MSDLSKDHDFREFTKRVIALAVANVVGNSVMQMLTGQDLGRAFDRSAYQILSLLTLWFVERSRRKVKDR